MIEFSPSRKWKKVNDYTYTLVMDEVHFAIFKSNYRYPQSWLFSLSGILTIHLYKLNSQDIKEAQKEAIEIALIRAKKALRLIEELKK